MILRLAEVLSEPEILYLTMVFFMAVEAFAAWVIVDEQRTRRLARLIGAWRNPQGKDGQGR
ncbi:hypothetical protein ACQP2C_12285 [Micromonospora zamorensis]|uniref:hypothetical protein n=1 Tax=Micromonospora zamorensis TaxID=709883 RepID=UPI003D97AFCD